MKERLLIKKFLKDYKKEVGSKKIRIVSSDGTTQELTSKIFELILKSLETPKSST